MKLLAILAAAALAASLATGAGAAVKPPKPAKPPKTQPVPPPPVTTTGPVTLVNTGATLELRAAGLTPGTHYDFTYQVFGAGNPYPYLLGGSTSRTVAADGTYIVTVDLAELYYAASPYALSEVIAWLRPVGSTVFDVSTNAAGVPLRAEYEFGY